MFKNPRSLLLAALALVFASSAFAQNDRIRGPINLVIEGVPAASVIAYSHGASNSGTATGGTTGRTNVQDMSLTRYTDSTSAAILGYAVSGRVLREVQLNRQNMQIIMSGVRVSSYSTAGESVKTADGTYPPQTENITLNFARISYSINGGRPTCFDVQADRTC